MAIMVPAPRCQRNRNPLNCFETFPDQPASQSVSNVLIFQKVLVPPISQTEVERELVARAAREQNTVVLNDKIICCYICVVVIVILILVTVIIVLSVMDDHKYKIF